MVALKFATTYGIWRFGRVIGGVSGKSGYYAAVALRYVPAATAEQQLNKLFSSSGRVDCWEYEYVPFV